MKNKIAAKAPFATFMLPLPYDLRLSAAKHNNITHAPAAARNLDAAIPRRSAETQLQNTKELPTTATQIAAPIRISTPKRENLWQWPHIGNPKMFSFSIYYHVHHHPKHHKIITYFVETVWGLFSIVTECSQNMTFSLLQQILPGSRRSCGSRTGNGEKKIKRCFRFENNSTIPSNSKINWKFSFLGFENNSKINWNCLFGSKKIENWKTRGFLQFLDFVKFDSKTRKTDKNRKQKRQKQSKKKEKTKTHRK